jgi:hypothetical protein
MLFGSSQSPALIILQVTLTFWETDPQVELSLVRNVETSDQGQPWRVPARDLGVPDDVDANTTLSLNLPKEVTDAIASSLAGEPKTLPLWLRFAKPHGYVGALPWERTLIAALGRPVLRFPDLLERPHENRDVFELAVCLDADRTTPPDKLQQQASQIVETILRASPRAQTRMHLFTPSFWYQVLKSGSFDKRLQIHDPSTAPTYGEAIARGRSSESGRPQSPWSIWMRGALGERSLDAVYFVCSSGMSEFGPAVRMSNSPSPKEKYDVWSYVDVIELVALVTRTGAWAALFSAPAGNSPGPILALVADAMAHTRPTSVLYQALTGAEQMASLQAACAFLFASRWAPAPLLADGFVYCPPNYVEAYANLHVSSVLPATELNASVFDSASLWDRARAYVTPYIPIVQNYEIKQAPSWAMAAQRQSEMLALDRLRRNSSDVLLSSSESARIQVSPDAHRSTPGASEDTLADIQKVIGDYLRKTSG